MKGRSRSIIILSILFGYILLQFLWWEILLVKQNGLIIDEKQKLMELSSADPSLLSSDISVLHHKKQMQTVMIVSEGTVFLLLLLFGIYKIKQSMDKESALNSQQKNFFLSVTHELKTPIAATKLQLQTLQKQSLDEQTRQHLLENALNETERLNHLIDNILFASRLESNEFIFKKDRTDLSTLVREIASRYYRTEITTGALKLKIENDLQVSIDTQAFPSVITNLVDNALKYSGDEKQIIISLVKDKNRAVLSVADQGVGIKDHEKPKVFGKFYRAGNEETRRTKGTGLGLYIVNYIVQKHHAVIRIKDNVPKGSVFEVILNAS
jgi:two-component system phosphate regulon sensor histidine kinase PhoR